MGQISHKERERAGNLAAMHFVETFLSLEKIQTIALFSSFGHEISTVPLAKKLESRAVQVVYPKISSATKTLSFFDGKPSVPGHYGIEEPDARSSAQVDINDIDAFVVPGLGFSKAGGRLGKGGGYYDTTLSESCDGLKIGYCFDDQIQDNIPMTSIDVFMDWLVTPKGAFDVQSVEASTGGCHDGQ